MGRMVIQQIDLTTTAATTDIWSVEAATAEQIILHGWELTSDAIAAALVELELHRFATIGSGGTVSGTEELLNELGSASTAVVHYGDTTVAAGAGDLSYYQWEQLGPVGQIYTPEMRPVIQAGDGICLNLVTASVITVSGFVCWEEI